MSRRTTEVDRSRATHLVHATTSSGRSVRVVAYIEGIDPENPRYEIASDILCRTSEQAAEIARVLRDAKAGGGA